MNKFYGQWNPPEDQVAYINYFSNYKQGIAIECGAGWHGNACRFFEESLGWKVIYIEPSKYASQNLKNSKINSFLYNNFVYNCGLGDKDGIVEFKDVVSAPGGGNDNGSFKHTPAHAKLLEDYQCVFETYPVQMITYTTLVKGIQQEISYLSLDVEGFELEVFKGMKGSKNLPRVMSVEYPISGFVDVLYEAEALGYIFDFVSFNNAFFHHSSYNLPLPEQWFGKTERMSDL